MTHSQEFSLLRVYPVRTFFHHTMSTKSTINGTTFSFRMMMMIMMMIIIIIIITITTTTIIIIIIIILRKGRKKEKKKAKENNLPVFYVSYNVLFLTLYTLRLSAVTDGSQTNVLETCSTAIIRVNAVRNPKVTDIYAV